MCHFYFNSIKVRLEPQNFKNRYEAAIFQFHKGTIRTILITVTINEVIDFNSIKVRLEQVKNHTFYNRCPFQFHKGTIRTLAGFEGFYSSIISIP